MSYERLLKSYGKTWHASGVDQEATVESILSALAIAAAVEDWDTDTSRLIERRAAELRKGAK